MSISPQQTRTASPLAFTQRKPPSSEWKTETSRGDRRPGRAPAGAGEACALPGCCASCRACAACAACRACEAWQCAKARRSSAAVGSGTSTGADALDPIPMVRAESPSEERLLPPRPPPRRPSDAPAGSGCGGRALLAEPPGPPPLPLADEAPAELTGRKRGGMPPSLSAHHAGASSEPESEKPASRRRGGRRAPGNEAPRSAAPPGREPAETGRSRSQPAAPPPPCRERAARPSRGAGPPSQLPLSLPLCARGASPPLPEPSPPPASSPSERAPAGLPSLRRAAPPAPFCRTRAPSLPPPLPPPLPPLPSLPPTARALRAGVAASAQPAGEGGSGSVASAHGRCRCQSSASGWKAHGPAARYRPTPGASAAASAALAAAAEPCAAIAAAGSAQLLSHGSSSVSGPDGSRSAHARSSGPSARCGLCARGAVAGVSRRARSLRGGRRPSCGLPVQPYEQRVVHDVQLLQPGRVPAQLLSQKAEQVLG